ncbi:helix-turn-helix domain-containing protein [Paenibacillus amylolyticus]|uniref:helix-turn-helix domain-containing protein n=1 Tax=Paenibacillus amylolyticus TaxID=1451 RepID=UPI003EBB4F06
MSNTKKVFEDLLKTVLQSEIAEMIGSVSVSQTAVNKKYLTMDEVSKLSGIGTYTLRQLTFSRAMPHRKVRSRIIFEQSEITDSITNYKKIGWDDPENKWNVNAVQSQITNFYQDKEKSPMIEDIFRQLIKEELESFSKEILSITKKEKQSYYGRTVLTIKEAAEHFRTSPATIYGLIKEDGMPHLKIQSRFYIVLEEAEAYLWRETAKSYADSGNIYWTQILQRLDWEETERELAYKKALKRLEERDF